jgi:hypothetical protein
MKTLEQLIIEYDDDAEVFRTEEFSDYIAQGFFNRFDGDGFFHDGEHRTDISIWDDKADLHFTTWEDFLETYPYIIWYNK